MHHLYPVETRTIPLRLAAKTTIGFCECYVAYSSFLVVWITYFPYMTSVASESFDQTLMCMLNLYFNWHVYTYSLYKTGMTLRENKHTRKNGNSWSVVLFWVVLKQSLNEQCKRMKEWNQLKYRGFLCQILLIFWRTRAKCCNKTAQ